jgi:aryl-alcohol dehydrogenase-like predicted oxidoreductase
MLDEAAEAGINFIDTATYIPRVRRSVVLKSMFSEPNLRLCGLMSRRTLP